MKRLLLFLILFSSGIAVLMFFIGDDDPGLPPVIEPAAESDDREARDAPPDSPDRSKADEPSGSFVRDLKLPVREEIIGDDGMPQEVLVALIKAGEVRDDPAQSEVHAKEVDFTLYDRTTAEKPVARGSADRAVLFAADNSAQSILQTSFTKEFLLQGNVEIRLLDRQGRESGTYLLSDHLILAEDQIKAPLVSRDGRKGSPVQVFSEGMEITGRGMVADLDRGWLRFDEDIRIDVTRFEIPVFLLEDEVVGTGGGGTTGSKKRNSTAATEGASGNDERGNGDKIAEKVTVTCDGPFTFQQREERPQSGNGDADPLRGGGTLSFFDNIVVTRGETTLDCDELVMELGEDSRGQVGLESFHAASPESQVVISSPAGQARCGRIEWRKDTSGSFAWLRQQPVFDRLAIPSLSGGTDGDRSNQLFRLTAGNDVSVKVIESPNGGRDRIVLHFQGGGELSPSAGTSADAKSFSVTGKEIFLTLRAAERTASADGEHRSLYQPEEVRVVGDAMIVMDGFVSAEEIVMKMEGSAPQSPRTLSLNGRAEVGRDDFNLRSDNLYVKMIPDLVSDITTDEGFILNITFTGLGGADQAGGTQADESRAEGGHVLVNGEGTLRLWWPENLEQPVQESPLPNRNGRIDGPYIIDIDTTRGEHAHITGQERFLLTTSTYEGRAYTILELGGSPHLALTRSGEKVYSLDCSRANVHLDPSRTIEDELVEGGGPAPVLPLVFPSKSGSNLPESSRVIRKIQASGPVHLCYFTSRTSLDCHSISWNLRDDRLIADGGADPVSVLMFGRMRFSGRRILLRPDREELTILKPEALFFHDGNPPGHGRPGAASDE